MNCKSCELELWNWIPVPVCIRENLAYLCGGDWQLGIVHPARGYN